MNFNQIFGKNVTYDDIKSDSKTKLYTLFRQYIFLKYILNPLSANPTKWSNTLKQFVANLPTDCLSVFDHFMNLALKRLRLRRNGFF